MANKQVAKVFLILLIMFLLLSEIKIYAYNPTAYNYGNQLSSFQKQLYDKFAAEIKIETTKINITFLFADKSVDTISNKLSDEEAEELIRDGVRDVQIALDAFLKDYPDIYWFKFGQDGVGTSYNYIGKYSGGVYTWSVKEAFFNIKINDSYVHNINNIQNLMRDAINNFTVTGTTRYQRLKSIHDQLADSVDYVINAEFAHEPTGALLYGEAVCEGYAKAFKLLCDKHNIPAVLVSGKGITRKGSEDHMWNYVQMEDGIWYAVDLTWNDQSTVYYDFFLVGRKTKDIHFGGKEFGDTHIENGEFSGIGLFIFSFPELSITAYENSVSPTAVKTNTPSPSNTPDVTNTPIKTNTPVVTKTPVFTKTPYVTETPEQTRTVNNTNTPVPTENRTDFIPYATPSDRDIVTPTATQENYNYMSNSLYIVIIVLSSGALILLIVALIRKR